MSAIAWSRDGRRIATASYDGTVRIWDPETGHELGILGRYESVQSTISFLPDGKTLAGLDVQGTVRWWLTDSFREKRG